VQKAQLLLQCKGLVTNQWWGAFEDLLKQQIEQELGVLCHTSDIGQVRETQGKIKSLRYVLALPEEINRSEKERLVK
jgi:hypothetical protein